MLNSIKHIIRKSPVIRKLLKIRTNIIAIRENKLCHPPGHFYSPIPSIKEIEEDESLIFESIPHEIKGICLQEAEQLNLLNKLVEYYNEIPPFPKNKQEGFRFYHGNPEYKNCDAVLLYCMIRHLRPSRIFEVGSGFSSSMILDTNELFFSNSIETVFIDPYPQRIQSLITDEDKKRVKIIKSRLQEVDLSEFRTLQHNDILFIDSTHVCKTNSDVNHIFFEILPILSAGVIIHFHDIFYPFEYPKKWVYEGRAWNEAYLLRAFLQYNNAFRLVLMNSYIKYFHEPFFQKNMPLCLGGGGSIWLRKE
jgi:predicted O-methyltransferase YrrM